LLAVAALAVMGGTARAAITISSVDNSLVSPDGFTSFDGGGLLQNDVIGGEFGGDGVTFTGGLIFAPCANWPNTAGGWSPAGYGATIGPGCVRNTTVDDFSMIFSAAVEAVSFMFHSDAVDGGALLLEVLAGGVVQESLTLDESNDTWCCGPGYMRIDAITFDEIRVTELAPLSQSWIAIDNLAFDFAETVPEPAPLAALGLGFVALARLRRVRARR
jgi:hypothetical protein